MATSNTLTAVLPSLFAAMNVVGRELVGFIPAVTRDSRAERAAVGQAVTVPIGAAGDVEDVTPGATPANSGGTTPDAATITITKSRAAPILWSGEERLAVGPQGIYNDILMQQFADGIRKLCNEIEVDLALEAKLKASRAYGTAGTAPFATAGNFEDFAGVRKILEDNGAPISDLQLALNGAAMFNLRGKQSGLFKVSEAGRDDMLRNGMTDRIEGFALRHSAGHRIHTIGTGNGAYDTNSGTTNAIGDTVIPVDTGAGTIVAGDVVTFAGTTANKYVVASALSGGNVTLNKPGLITAVADGLDVAQLAAYTANSAFARSALVLAARAPALPEGGDSADDRYTLTDPVTGLQFEVSLYRQYRRVKIEIALAWGVSGIRPEFIATLLG